MRRNGYRNGGFCGGTEREFSFRLGETVFYFYFYLKSKNRDCLVVRGSTFLYGTSWTEWIKGRCISGFFFKIFVIVENGSCHSFVPSSHPPEKQGFFFLLLLIPCGRFHTIGHQEGFIYLFLKCTSVYNFSGKKFIASNAGELDSPPKSKSKLQPSNTYTLN